MVDKKFDDSEYELIKMKANGVSSEDMDEMIHDMLKSARDKPIYIPTLFDDEKFEYLYNIVQLMKIDSQVYLSEINFCE